MSKFNLILEKWELDDNSQGKPPPPYPLQGTKPTQGDKTDPD